MRYNLPIPYGWYCISLSKELDKGDVKALKYFGQDLVLFRTESGEAVVLDAYCPHLGAHLGHGGKVDGENIACPFHGWQFNSGGQCDKVPYASQVPPKIQGKDVIRRYPVSELNGLIYAWYHPRAIAPLFEVENVPELDSNDWTELEVYDWEIGTIIQESGENAVDTAHFLYVHSATTLPEGDIVTKGHRRTTDVKMMMHAMDESTGEVDLEGDDFIEGTLVTKNIGPGQTVQYFRTYFETIMIGTITPIDDQNIHLRFLFSQPREATEPQKVIARGVIDNVVFQVGQDIPIWEHKKYQENPILCDGDGPINKYRKWFRQFYDNLKDLSSNAA